MLVQEVFFNRRWSLDGLKTPIKTSAPYL